VNPDYCDVRHPSICCWNCQSVAALATSENRYRLKLLIVPYIFKTVFCYDISDLWWPRMAVLNTFQHLESLEWESVLFHVKNFQRVFNGTECRVDVQRNTPGISTHHYCIFGVLELTSENCLNIAGFKVSVAWQSSIPKISEPCNNIGCIWQSKVLKTPFGVTCTSYRNDLITR